MEPILCSMQRCSGAVGAGADHLFFLTFFAERLFVGVEEQSDCHPAVRTVPASVGDPVTLDGTRVTGQSLDCVTLT